MTSHLAKSSAKMLGKSCVQVGPLQGQRLLGQGHDPLGVALVQFRCPRHSATAIPARPSWRWFDIEPGWTFAQQQVALWHFHGPAALWNPGWLLRFLHPAKHLYHRADMLRFDVRSMCRKNPLSARCCSIMSVASLLSIIWFLIEPES